MLRLRKPSDLCSRTVSDPANRLRKTRKKKSSVVPLFRSGRRSPIFARIRNKGKVGVQRGRKTAGCPSFLPPRRVPQRPAVRRRRIPTAESQRKTPRPLGANPPAAVRVPRSAGAGKKSRPVKGEHACGSSCAPVSRCRKQKNSTLFRVLLRITNAYAFLINASRRSRPLSISVSEVA